MNEREPTPLRRFVAHPDGCGWEGVERHVYKEDGAAPFRDVTRQTLFAREDLAGELRYFEVAAGGYSTLERHAHVHAVMILQGSGAALVGEATFAVRPFDLVTVAPGTWHQFRAVGNAPLGFLCMVDARRDRPEIPDEAEFERLRANPALAEFLR
ncbi:MAG: cupin domain-containing protein [Casimicrobiaceae bacterium]